MSSLYCHLCVKKSSCTIEGTCHGLVFSPFKAYQDIGRGVYIPNDLEASYALLIASSCQFKELSKQDEGRLNQTIVLIYFSGNRPRRVFKGFAYYHADIGKVGNEFADVWLKDRIAANPQTLEGRYGPIRAGINTGKLFILGYE
jgi:hypothetical protein